MYIYIYISVCVCAYSLYIIIHNQFGTLINGVTTDMPTLSICTPNLCIAYQCYTLYRALQHFLS